MFSDHPSIFAAIGAIIVVFSLAACGSNEADVTVVPGRWYSAEQILLGQEVFQQHCADCHGERAQGLADDWRITDANGNYPPPPLDGSAHAWHHPMEVLESTIAEGGASFGGVMPGFEGVLDRGDSRATIAYFQSLWTDDIYARWQSFDER